MSTIKQKWDSISDHTSWESSQIKEKLRSEAKEEIVKHMSLIQTCVALAPLFGLLGTVTGMIEVFQVMAFTGGGDARSMAGGVSKATLPTMAGMTTALSGVFATIYLNSAKSREEERIKELIKN
jgi:biopolymer transport protein ExbB